MAKRARQRAMPSTPAAHPPTRNTPARAAGSTSATSRPATPAPRAKVGGTTKRIEVPYLIAGTDCIAGHVRDQELDGGRIGTVPTRKQSRIGFALVVWCLGGLAVMSLTGITTGGWARFGAQIALLWLAFTAVLVRRAGHRGRCWRTRTWRHAWGGLVPGPDRTREREARG